MKQKRTKKQGKPIKLRAGTIVRLDKLKHQGQSYDGVVTELIDFYDAKVKDSGKD